MPTAVSIPSTFKRLRVGSIFTSTQNGTNGKRFRKVGKTQAFALLSNGRGQTATRIQFSRSAAVAVTDKGDITNAS